MSRSGEGCSRTRTTVSLLGPIRTVALLEEVTGHFKGLSWPEQMWDMDRGHSRVLGYPYVGSCADAGLMVFYISHPISVSDDIYPLYSFRVPNHNFTEQMRDQILSDMEKHSQVLRQYGYEVRTEAMTIDTHQFIDCLPQARA